MVNNPVQIVLFEDELLKFLESSDNSVDGIAYSWENENVTHLHICPIAHAFGVQAPCHFIKSQSDYQQSKDWTVLVLGNGDYKVYSPNVDKPIPFEIVPYP